jgi:hypothetical protein
MRSRFTDLKSTMDERYMTMELQSVKKTPNRWGKRMTYFILIFSILVHTKQQLQKVKFKDPGLNTAY